MLALVLLGLLTTPDDVRLHSEPNSAAAIVGRHIPVNALRAFDYDKLGAAVFQIRGDWYQISLGTEKAWLRKTSKMVFHRYLDLLTRRAPLLTRNWDAKIYADPGRNPADSPQLKQTLRDRGSMGAKILSRALYEGQLWFQIQTPAPDACGELPLDVSPSTGWIPAHDSQGEPYIWFSSMGC